MIELRSRRWIAERGGFAECLEKALVPRAGIEPARLAAGDFESPVFGCRWILLDVVVGAT